MKHRRIPYNPRAESKYKSTRTGKLLGTKSTALQPPSLYALSLQSLFCNPGWHIIWHCNGPVPWPWLHINCYARGECVTVSQFKFSLQRKSMIAGQKIDWRTLGQQSLLRGQGLACVPIWDTGAWSFFVLWKGQAFKKNADELDH